MAHHIPDPGDPPAGDARYDEALGAWVLTRYADVSVALRHPHLRIPGTDGGHAARPERAPASAPQPSRLAAWPPESERLARELVLSLPAGRMDLVRDYAGPWTLALAASVVGIPRSDAERLARHARVVFQAAAESTDGEVQPAALRAAAELSAGLPAGSEATIGVQAFVALTHTLPGFLASLWHRLFRDRALVGGIRDTPARLPQAIDEILRAAGPARAVFRRAGAALSIGAARIRPGERVILMLAAANHDPRQFPEPDRLDLARGGAGHLAFGRGLHGCAGAQLIRLASAAATGALLDEAAGIELTGEPEWGGGFAIRVPVSLPALLRRATPSAFPGLPP
jgi:cytochrome P450